MDDSDDSIEVAGTEYGHPSLWHDAALADGAGWYDETGVGDSIINEDETEISVDETAKPPPELATTTLRPSEMRRMESTSSLYGPAARSVADVEKLVPPGDGGLIWHAQVLADDFKPPKKLCRPDGSLKPRRPLPIVRASDFFSSLVQTADGRWVKPAEMEGAEHVVADPGEVYNFFTAGNAPFVAEVRTGFAQGLLANKGSVLCRLVLEHAAVTAADAPPAPPARRTLCFAHCHMAANLKSLAARNAEFHTVAHSKLFLPRSDACAMKVNLSTLNVHSSATSAVRQWRCPIDARRPAAGSLHHSRVSCSTVSSSCSSMRAKSAEIRPSWNAISASSLTYATATVKSNTCAYSYSVSASCGLATKHTSCALM